MRFVAATILFLYFETQTHIMTLNIPSVIVPSARTNRYCLSGPTARPLRNGTQQWDEFPVSTKVFIFILSFIEHYVAYIFSLIYLLRWTATDTECAMNETMFDKNYSWCT